MICRCCGRHTRTAPAGASTRVVRFYFWSPGYGWRVLPSNYGIPGQYQAEILCWRCAAWSDERSPAFGKLYATR